MFRALSIRWRLAGAFFIIIFVLVSSVGLYLLDWTEANYVRSISNDLRRESNAVAQSAVMITPEVLPNLVKRIGQSLDHRITVIGSDGTVLGDSEHDFRQMPNHSDRPEVRQALATGYGTTTRYSATIKTDMLYVATRHKLGGDSDGVVRVAEPLSGMKVAMSTIQRTFVLAGLAALLLAAVLSFRLALSITNPIEEIAGAARKLAGGDLTARAPSSARPHEEMGILALTFNHMAEELQSTIHELTEQKARMQIIFDKTDDGLVLIGTNDRVQMINPVACDMLAVDCLSIIGQTVIECTLSHDLAELVERVIRTGEPSALDITLPNTSESAVSAYVAPIMDGGALIVLHDMTESKRLDAVRRDFVANVSHELRTPLASIKAMAETILLRHENNPAVAPQFAQSIVAEADRMTLLAEDLLDLAQIESGHSAQNHQSIDLGELVSSVFDSLCPVAEARSISLVSETADVGIIQADHDSVTQIMVNLIDNAIKYSNDDGKVVVSARREGEFAEIHVSDNGIGIPQADLPRVFERFYRVDKARSRESDGTGLGLSIVKHLAELMGGSVSVVSELGKGTTFTVVLPARQTLSQEIPDQLT